MVEPVEMTTLAICVDFGSTFTKAALVDLAEGRIVASTSSPTTIGTDVLEGYAACRARLVALDPRAETAEVHACSSAGGGLRIAVVGNEELVTAEAGRRVALSSGGKVVAVVAASSASRTIRLPDAAGDNQNVRDVPDLGDLRAARPDVVLLTGGTDGGNAEVLVALAAELTAQGWTGPTVVAGNVDAHQAVAAALDGTAYVLADNVVPKIGVLAPDSARAAIREMFLKHVIGGKHLSASDDFAAMVRGATPDVVLTGVELLAHGLDEERPGVGDVVVVDVGGATTDVHSVVELDPEDAGLAREVVATTPVTRTVEGDLGMRWSAGTTIAAAHAAGLPGEGLPDESWHAEPGWLPVDQAEEEADEAIARAAATLALRRHAGRAQVVVGTEGRVVERSGKDLREVGLVVCSGGVFRNGRPGAEIRILAGATGVVEGGWQLPEQPRVVVDRDYVLAAAGLLATAHPEAAYRLAMTLGGPRS